MNTEAEFKAIPRLRWHLDEDGCPIAKTRSRKNPKDHLYFHGPGVLGVYYERMTERRARAARRRLLDRFGARAVGGLEGDFDGTVLFRVVSPLDVPEEFLRSESMGYAAKGAK